MCWNEPYDAIKRWLLATLAWQWMQFSMTVYVAKTTKCSHGCSPLLVSAVACQLGHLASICSLRGACPVLLRLDAVEGDRKWAQQHARHQYSLLIYLKWIFTFCMVLQIQANTDFVVCYLTASLPLSGLMYQRLVLVLVLLMERWSNQYHWIILPPLGCDVNIHSGFKCRSYLSTLLLLNI